MIYKSFTIKFPTKQRELKTSVLVSDAIEGGEEKEFSGLWDTGATTCAISERIVRDLDLKPIGVIEITTANGSATCPQYRIRIRLPNDVIKIVTAPASDMGPTDLLIGMDVIGGGDFVISSNPKNGRMGLSYRSPSMRLVDFVTETEAIGRKSRKKDLAKRKKERQNRKKSHKLPR